MDAIAVWAILVYIQRDVGEGEHFARDRIFYGWYADSFPFFVYGLLWNV